MSFENSLKKRDKIISVNLVSAFVLSILILIIWGENARFEMVTEVNGTVKLKEPPKVIKNKERFVFLEKYKENGNDVKVGDKIFKGCYYNENKCIEKVYESQAEGVIYYKKLLIKNAIIDESTSLYYLYDVDEYREVVFLLPPMMSYKVDLGDDVKILSHNDNGDVVEVVSKATVINKSRLVNNMSYHLDGYLTVAKVSGNDVVQGSLYDGMSVSVYVSEGYVTPIDYLVDKFRNSVSKVWVNNGI